MPANPDPTQCCGQCKWCDDFTSEEEMKAATEPFYPAAFNPCENENSEHYARLMIAEDTCPCFTPKENKTDDRES